MTQFSTQDIFIDDTLITVLTEYIYALDIRIDALLKLEAKIDIASIEGMIADLCWQIQQSRNIAASKYHHLSASVVESFSYALAAYTDEYLIFSLQNKLPPDLHGAIEKQLFGTSNSGEQFFSKVISLIGKRLDREVALAAVYLMLLSLGFKGRYLSGILEDELNGFYYELARLSLKGRSERKNTLIKSNSYSDKVQNKKNINKNHVVALFTFSGSIILIFLIYLQYNWSVASRNINEAIIKLERNYEGSATSTLASGKVFAEPAFAINRPVASRDFPSSLEVEEKFAESVDHKNVASIASASEDFQSAMNSDISTSNIRLFFGEWADSWTRRDIDKYLSHYSSSFVPEQGLTRKAWVSERRRRFAKSNNISVKLKVNSLRASVNGVSVEVEQTYHSSRLNSFSVKTFLLVRENKSWLIVGERINSEVPIKADWKTKEFSALAGFPK